MKKLVASISAAALGTTALQAAAYAPGLSAQERSKPWSVSLGLRGFYDDNYLSAPRGSSAVRDSYGVDIRPSIGLNLPLSQTYIGAEYTFSAKYYEDSARQDEPWDLSHYFDLALDHAFAPQHTIQVDDRFTISQDPEILDSGTFYRTEGSYLNNRGSIDYSAGLSRRLGLVVGYQNNYWDFEQEDEGAQATPPLLFSNPSRSGLLDRMEHLALLNLRYQIQPDTVGLLGINFGVTDYTGDEFITSVFDPGTLLPYPGGPKKSSDRNNRSYNPYIGVEHNFTRLMSLAIRGGAQWTDYYNDPTTSSQVSPTGDISYNYMYRPGSRLTAGVNIFRSATDVVSPDPTTGEVTQDRLATSLYARLVHQFFPRFHGTLSGQWQWAEFNGGTYSGETDNFYRLGASLRYAFNNFLSADAGYSFGYLDSDIPNRGYTRNRVYIGLTGSY